MAYDPADLRLPGWLLRLFDALIRVHVPLAPGWRIAMTRSGVMVVLAMLGVWAAALYSGNNLLYLCGAMLTGLVAAVVLQGAALLRSIPAPADMALPVLEAGQVHVLRKHFPLTAGAAAMVDISWPFGDGRFDLQGRCSGNRVLISGRLRTDRRGVFALEKACLSSEAPLGLLKLSKYSASACNVYVLPAAVPWQAEPAAGAQDAALRDGDEWRDLRAYVPGDALARVHWRKVAAHAQVNSRDWSVKRFATDQSALKSAHLCVDLTLPEQADASDFERLLGKAWYWLQQQRGRPGSFALGQQLFDTGEDEQVVSAMRALAACRPDNRGVADGASMLLSLVGSRA